MLLYPRHGVCLPSGVYCLDHARRGRRDTAVSFPAVTGVYSPIKAQIDQQNLYQIDIPLLYVPLTPEAIENGYKFYGLWYDSPGAVKVGHRHPLSRSFPPYLNI